jgi:segregation and condensation protein A
MSDTIDSDTIDPFDAPDLPSGEGEAMLVVDLDGFEGPLDLLLDLARRDKLDLHTISILDLADQYIAFIREAQRLRLELAGDYLVMAAWLTYLKSRLLLPKRKDDAAPDAADLVQDLSDRLRRLEAIRKAGQTLGDYLDHGRETLPRGAAEAVIVTRRMAWDANLYDLLGAYAERRQAQAKTFYRITTRKTLSIPDARAMLERLIGRSVEWCPIEVLLGAIQSDPAERRSTYASSFVAALELAREGRIGLKQEKAFAPLYLRAQFAP